MIQTNLGCRVWGVGCRETSCYFSVRAPRLRKENRALRAGKFYRNGGVGMLVVTIPNGRKNDEQASITKLLRI
ncbi:MAG: hypothetical protein F6J93_32790 [Oscillatoria sp. SIO1A7]|nr:hypothetical protein [Oscillatoria sp. SIO1A7]